MVSIDEREFEIELDQLEAQERQPELTALGALGARLYPLLHWLARGERRKRLEQRLDLRKQAIRDAKAKAALKATIQQEATWFAQIIIACWERQGFYHRFKSEHDGPRRGSKGKKQSVKFAAMMGNEQVIYFKVLTRKRGMVGYRSALPYGVRVIDLISDETLAELSRSCDRRVALADFGFDAGVWLAVYRLHGMDGIPNQVRFGQLMNQVQFKHPEKCPLILGVGLHRQIQFVYLSDYPHGLIGGSTGSGKSNFINALICQIALTQPASDVKLVLIDLKMGMEFGTYRALPHLARDIVATEQDAIEVLKFLLNEMIARMKTFSEAGIRKLEDWNTAHPNKRLARVICIVDEYAELAMSESKEIRETAENLIRRITNLGRASGIHCIVATQRPAVDILSNRIKVNMPLIVGGRVQSMAQNAVLLNKGRADELPRIPGRMIAETGQDSFMFQAAYISDAEIIDSVRYAKGAALGLVAIKDHARVVNVERLNAFIGERGGIINKKTGLLLSEYGITADLWRRYVQEQLANGNAARDGQTIRLVNIPQVAQIPTMVEPPAAPPAPVEAPKAPQSEPLEVLPQQVTEPPAPPAPAVEAPETPTIIAPVLVADVDSAIIQFIHDQCEFSGNVTVHHLFEQYIKYCEARQFPTGNQIDLIRRLKMQGLTFSKVGRDRIYEGLSCKMSA